MKQQILETLRASGGYVSGQELCDRFQVSRTAVWKQIRQLREEGYQIEAVPNRGYRMICSPDTVAAEEVLSRMRTRWLAHKVHYFRTIDSTNQYAKRMGEEGAPEGLLVIAEEQTAGKGRSGRQWTTPPGTAIAMTVLLRPGTGPERISMVTLLMGMAVAGAIRELYDLDAGIKWPNDVVIGGRKISGILTEMSAEMNLVHYIVIGVGINANVRDFPEELQKTASSLALELGRDVNRAQLAAEVMCRFEGYYEVFLRDQDLSELKEEYHQMLLNKNRPVRVLQPGAEYTGVARGINELGELLVEREDGSCERVYAGEVSVRGIYGYV